MFTLMQLYHKQNGVIMQQNSYNYILVPKKLLSNSVIKEAIMGCNNSSEVKQPQQRVKNNDIGNTNKQKLEYRQSSGNTKNVQGIAVQKQKQKRYKEWTSLGQKQRTINKKQQDKDRIIQSQSQLLTYAYKHQQEYISQIFALIQANPNLQLLLHPQLLHQLKQISKQYYLNKQKKFLLAALLQHYVIFSSSVISDYHNSTHYEDFKNFGQIYGNQISEVFTKALKGKKQIFQILEYKDLYEQSSFVVYASAYHKIKEEVKLMCSNNLLASFYLSSYFVRSTKKMETLAKPYQICKRLKQFIIQILIEQQEKHKKNLNDQEQLGQKFQIEQYLDSNYQPIKIDLSKEQQANKQKIIDAFISQLLKTSKKSLNNFKDILYGCCLANKGYNFKIFTTKQQDKIGTYQIKISILWALIENRYAHLGYKQEQIERQKQLSNILKCKNIQQLINQQYGYITHILSNVSPTIKTLQLNLKNIIKGSCTFSSYQSIAKTLDLIKKTVERERKIKNRKVAILSIQNQLKQRSKDVVIHIKLVDLICQFRLILTSQEEVLQRQVYMKLRQISQSKLISSVLLLYQWNQLNVSRYMKQLQGQIMYIGNIMQRTVAQNNMRLLITILRYQPIINPSPSPTSNNIKPRTSIKRDISFILDGEKKQSVGNYEDKWNLQGQQEYGNPELYQEIGAVAADPNKISQVQRYTKLNSVECLYALERYQAALNFYNTALAAKPSKKTTNTPSQAPNPTQEKQIKSKTLQTISQIHVILKDYPQALKHLKQQLKIKQQIGGKEHSSVAETLAQIGGLHVLTRKHREALECYQKALMIVDRTEGKENSRYANLLKSIGTVYFKSEQYKQAYNYFNQSFTIMQKFKQLNAKDAVDIIVKIAQTYIQQQLYQQAIKYLNIALEICNTNKSVSTLEYANVLDSLGKVYRQLNKYEQSLQVYRKALQIMEKVKQKHYLQYTNILDNVGLVNEHMKRWQATEYYQKAYMLKKNKSVNDVGFLRSYVSYLRTQTKSKYFVSQWTQLIPQYVEIMNKNYKQDSLDRAQYHTLLASMYNICNKEQQAYNQYQKAVVIYQNYKKKQNRTQKQIQTTQYANLIKNMGELQYKLKMNKKSMQKLQKCKQIYARVYGAQSKKYMVISKDIDNFKQKLQIS